MARPRSFRQTFRYCAVLTIAWVIGATATDARQKRRPFSFEDYAAARAAEVDRPDSVTFTESSGDLTVAIPNSGVLNQPLTIAHTGSVVDVDVRVRIDHTFDQDLSMWLIGPDGTAVPLALSTGDQDDNFGNGPSSCAGTPTVFDDSAAVFIEAGVAPFAGRYRPQGALAAFRGKGVSGDWTLRIVDIDSQDAGTLFCWQLTIRRRSLPADFGIGRNSLAYWRSGSPSAVTERSLSSSGATSFPAGQPGDIPVPANYLGQSTRFYAMFRPSTGGWLETSPGTAIAFGINGDIPVPADYNADGADDIAVFRPSNGTWYLRNIGVIQYGTAGDIPVPGDYNGDGAADVAVFRPSNGTWYINNVTAFAWGAPGDIPVPADYDGDGKMDAAVFRPSNGTWYIATLAGPTAVLQWGTNADIPVAGDYDGDGRDDIAVWRPSDGRWYMYNIGAIQFGQAGDIPLTKRPSYPGYPY
jgi:subtilisin-like proprotein convertase family protein